MAQSKRTYVYFETLSAWTPEELCALASDLGTYDELPIRIYLSSDQKRFMVIGNEGVRNKIRDRIGQSIHRGDFKTVIAEGLEWPQAKKSLEDGSIRAF